ncbi:hypothetical protein E4U42_008067 [Claviceps africana]|uniref:Uncharacterized protein n=1 Tax=Claviceps africana TaxID=83212 RepID=A0A8K0J5Y5_9HYPO|nr:hypothetical protein E4U42_008067 [Claviceps africana]
MRATMRRVALRVSNGAPFRIMRHRKTFGFAVPSWETPGLVGREHDLSVDAPFSQTQTLPPQDGLDKSLAEASVDELRARLRPPRRMRCIRPARPKTPALHRHESRAPPSFVAAMASASTDAIFILAAARVVVHLLFREAAPKLLPGMLCGSQWFAARVQEAMTGRTDR